MAEEYTFGCIVQQPRVFARYNARRDPSQMNLGDRVKQARKHARLTQVALADAVGTKQQTIQKLESGKAETSAFLAAIAVACRVSTSWLVLGEGEMVESQAVSSEAEKLVSRRNEIGLSVPDVHARMLSYEWPEGVTPPTLATVEDWFSGRRRPLDMTYRGMLYRALGLDDDGNPSPDGIAKTEVGARILHLAETGDPDEAAHMLAMWETMRKTRRESK